MKWGPWNARGVAFIKKGGFAFKQMQKLVKANERSNAYSARTI